MEVGRESKTESTFNIPKGGRIGRFAKILFIIAIKNS